MFRMGGDEFVIIMPSTSKEAALHVAEQLKDKEKLFRIEERQLSISFGISVMESRTDNFEKCVAESDRNMYLEKKEKAEKRK